MNNSGYSNVQVTKIIQVIINTISAISLLYYFAHIDQKLLSEDGWNRIILAIFIAKFVVDVMVFKAGFASFSLALLLLPIISLLAFGPSGEVQPLFNNRTQLIEKHFYLLAFSAMFFYYSWSMLLLITKKTFSNFDVNLLKYLSEEPKSLLATWLFSIVSIVAAIIYLPDLPGKSYGELSAALLPGNAWNAVAIIAYFFVIIGVKKSVIRKFSLVFVPFWLLSHFARVDILGLVLLGYMIFTNVKKGKFIKEKFNLWKVALLAIGIFLFAYLGVVRDRGLVFDPGAILDSLLMFFNYLTVQDLLYSTAAAIEVNHMYGSFPTLLNYIPQMIPSFLIQSSEGAPHIVASYIHTNFGLLIYGEYYLNYRLIGVFVAPFITYMVLFFPILALRMFFGRFGFVLGYYLLLTTSARVFWYGYIYYIKPLFLIVPVFILIYWFISSIEKQMAKIPALKTNVEQLRGYAKNTVSGR